MFVVLGFYKRKSGLTHEQFSEYWRDVHGPMIRNHPEVSRHIKRYVQHHISPNDMGATTALGFDGFSETWYESRADREALQRSSAFLNEIVPDEAEFLDLSATRTSMFDHQVVQIGSAPWPLEQTPA
ncbi:EthD domain-containing protein [uncultured Brevundimonas sp.]|uniref:EthD domain-containing protein n=1 Tax=uncultured Brevundimonas sp. TaxID=213418 RepID=UPI0025D49CCE|nr:EthD domain-containing protein [uncultured Brevundimonas sp.]